MKCIVYAVFAGCLLLADVCAAETLRFGRYFSDNMVIQREKPTVIRGVAEPGAEVKVSFASQEKAGKADESGAWMVTLDPMPANAKGLTLTAVSASGKQRSEIRNVVVGDVLLCAWQTSIDITLGRDEAGRQAASGHKTDSGFRAIRVRSVPQPAPQSDLAEEAASGWQEVDKDVASGMTAAAYYLGRDLASAVDVPIGIVDVNMGPQFVMAWLSRDTLLDPVPGLGGYVVSRTTDMEKRYQAFLDKTPWGKHRTILTENPLESPFYPAAGFNSVLVPLGGVAFKGVVLQAGNDYPYYLYEEARAAGKIVDRDVMSQMYATTYDLRKEGYRMEPVLINRMTGDWRKVLGDGALPIAFVAPPSSALYTYAIHNREMRELQRKVAMQEEATHMILPGMDHVPFSGQPQDAKRLADRCLKWAEGALYGKSDGLGSGPFFERFEGEGAQVTLHYREGTASGLKAETGALDHFEVADDDAGYVPAKAVIKGETIELTTDRISRISHVRYNWIEKPDQGLVNQLGLPAVPFKTDGSSHEWFVQHKENDLPEEYFTPANEWQSGVVTLINSELEGVGYPHFSGWIGPIGILTGPFGPNMGVREVKKGSPADGKLFEGDVIYSANGEMLGDEEEMTMVDAITACEATDGKLVLGVNRNGKLLDIELTLEVLGPYSETSPWNCVKTKRIVSNLERSLAAQGCPPGFLYTDAMFLLGAGSPEYQWIVRKTASAGIKDAARSNWHLGYAAQYLSEYYLATGDKRVLPQIQTICDQISAMQIREDNNRNGGWYGRGNQPRSYPAMSHAAISAMLGLTLARECGVNVDAETFQRGLAYLKRTGAPIGEIIYGDVYRSTPTPINKDLQAAGKLSTSNGKVAEAAVLYQLLGDKDAADINSNISTYSWHSTYGGHGGHFWDVYWTPLGAAVQSESAYQYFMKNHRWFRECFRMFDGSFAEGGGAGLALVVPRRRLRILGAPKSPFSPGAPATLKPALDAYFARDYKRAEALCQKLLDAAKPNDPDRPTLSRLAEEARRMQDGIAADLAAIESLSKTGRRQEAGLILETLQPVMAEGDTRLAAAMALMNNSKARPDEKAIHAATLSAGAGMDSDEANAESADDLARIQEQKRAAAAAAAAAALTWEPLTTAEVQKGAPNAGRRPASEATKWKLAILESRERAPDGWEQPGFDDSGWISTVQPVSWHMNHEALQRTTFTVTDRTAYDALKFNAWVFRQQDVAIYLNGTLIGRINNVKNSQRIEHSFKKAAVEVLRNGENTLAIATRHNWRWGMKFMYVYNGGFDFVLFGGKPAK